MDYRIIALDLDGTLLPKTKKIPWATKLYLRKLTKRGYHIVLASGRPNRALEVFHRQIRSKAPMICYNGAFSFHPLDPAFPTFVSTLPQQIIKDIYNGAQKDKIITNIMLETHDKIWFKHHDAHLAEFFWLSNMDITYGDINKTLQEDTMTAIFQLNRSPSNDKIMLDLVHQHPGLILRFWGRSPYAELYYDGTSKATCLQHVADYYHLKMENVIAFGDASNDLEMLKAVGLGVAMLNGRNEVKAVAKMISVADNEHQGVKKTLKRILSQN